MRSEKGNGGNMRLTRTFLQSLSIDSAMAYELYDLNDGPKSVNPKIVRGIRIALISFLIIVLIGAISILGIGIWTLEAEYGNRQVSELINAQIYKVDSYLMIIGGSAIIAISIVGFFGVLKDYRCLMGLHIGLLSFLSVMLFVAGVLGYVLVSELEDKVKEKMEDVLIYNYGVDVLRNTGNSVITKAWDRVQEGFECCGVRGDHKSTNSWLIYEKSDWFTKDYSNGSLVPESCCRGAQDIMQCTGVIPSNVSIPRGTSPGSAHRNYTGFKIGCFDVLDSYLHGTGITIGTTAIVVGLFMLVELALSICFYRTLPEKS